MTSTHSDASPCVAVLGVRHHGPGSARAVAAALAEFAPDRVLIEGPADAGALIPLAGAAAMEPPVALFAYREADPQLSAFWPFAAFSPEWAALRYALAHEVAAGFCDLPAAISLGLDRGGEGGDSPTDEAAEEPLEPADAAEPTAEPTPDETAAAEDEAPDEPALPRRREPIGQLAEAAGYEDGETWWEDVVEHRMHATDALDAFAAVAEAMAAVRAHEETSAFDAVREAHMRTVVRAALAEGAQRIAVVCGAYHVPALLGIEQGKASGLPTAKEDKAALATLPKASKATATALTWVPWTHSRLSYRSGYGAGIQSPGWYGHLFEYDDHIAERWLTRVAELLRQERVPVSSAHLIEGVRLAETLGGLRGRPRPGLAELTEATVAVLCEGSAERLSLIERELIVGDVLGAVPPETPMVPLAADLAREAKRLRLPRAAAEKTYDLDLRNPNDLDRSKLLRRLTLLDVPWGEPGHSRSTGTFRESWRVVWEPALEVKLVEASVWGTTLPSAATARMLERAAKEDSLAKLTGLVERCLAADLPDAVGPMVDAVQNRAAVDTDVAELAGALPPLVNVLRYRDVRGTRVESLTTVVRGLGVRLAIGLLGACVGIDDKPAMNLAVRMSEANAAIQLLEDPEVGTPWTEALTRVADSEGAHGVTAGRAVRLLSERGVFDTDAVAERMARALAQGTEPARAAAWLEGFLAGSGLLLAHDKTMLRLIDAWICDLEGERFETVLPLLRRTFGTFAGPERRAIAEQLPDLASEPADGASAQDAAALDADAPEWLLAARAEATATIQLLLTGTARERELV